MTYPAQAWLQRQIWMMHLFCPRRIVLGMPA